MYNAKSSIVNTKGGKKAKRQLNFSSGQWRPYMTAGKKPDTLIKKQSDEEMNFFLRKVGVYLPHPRRLAHGRVRILFSLPSQILRLLTYTSTFSFKYVFIEIS